MDTFSLKKIFTVCQARYGKCIYYLYVTFLKPKSENEDEKRAERILTFILFFTIIVTTIFQVGLLMQHIKLGKNYHGIPIGIFLTTLSIFCLLYVLTRKGMYRITRYIFIFILLIFATYVSYTWGASLPMGLLSYGLIVSIAGASIDSRFGFFVATISCLCLVFIGLRENSLGIIPNWKRGVIERYDIFGYALMILLTTLLSRLSNKEIESSLMRARSSEEALREERDNLEITVRQRTQVLRESERERMRELYRFAEFGKISSGVFHDLLNPLTAVSLSISRLTSTQETSEAIKTALQATKRMEQFMSSIRKQVKADDLVRYFSLNEEIEDAINIMHYKAEKQHVYIRFSAHENLHTGGNPLKFNQIITNLISNSIDAYENLNIDKLEKIIEVSLVKEKGKAIITVRDHGKGIDDKIAVNIFSAFFTTKEKGIGLGLSTTKDIVESSFRGTITCSSLDKQGTAFIVTIPLNNT